MLADNQGTVRDVAQYDSLSDTTTVVDHLQYDSFGNITSQTNANLTPPFAYTGRDWDADSGLYYYRARWYDAGTGRFLSEDPLGLAAGDTNLQRYVHNSPLNATDPTGLDIIPGLDEYEEATNGWVGDGWQIMGPPEWQEGGGDDTPDDQGEDRQEGRENPLTPPRRCSPCGCDSGPRGSTPPGGTPGWPPSMQGERGGADPWLLAQTGSEPPGTPGWGDPFWDDYFRHPPTPPTRRPPTPPPLGPDNCTETPERNTRCRSWCHVTVLTCAAAFGETGLGFLACVTYYVACIDACHQPELRDAGMK
jgi:RHS repeat-associated protein